MSDKQKKKGGFGVIKLLLLMMLIGVAAVIGYGFTLDDVVKIERSVIVDADPRDVHTFVGDLRAWDDWGPWRDDDPDMTYTYSDSTTDVGSKMSWTMKQGSGALWFTKTDRDTGVKYKFQWEDWTPTDGGVRYEEQPDGKTKVTWYMHADMSDSYFGRYFMHVGKGNMTEMFDKGLAKLKTKVEAN